MQVAGIAIVVSEAPENTKLPMVAREAGRVMVRSEVQREKLKFPMLVREPGSVTVARELQPAKAKLPMVARGAGRVMVVRDVQSAKALSPMLVREVPLELGRVRVVREVQPEKVPLSIVVREAGRVTVIREARSKNPPRKLVAPAGTTMWGSLRKGASLRMRPRAGSAAIRGAHIWGAIWGAIRGAHFLSAVRAVAAISSPSLPEERAWRKAKRLVVVAETGSSKVGSRVVGSTPCHSSASTSTRQVGQR